MYNGIHVIGNTIHVHSSSPVQRDSTCITNIVTTTSSYNVVILPVPVLFSIILFSFSLDITRFQWNTSISEVTKEVVYNEDSLDNICLFVGAEIKDFTAETWLRQ